MRKSEHPPAQPEPEYKEEARKFEEFLESKSRSTTLGIPGYYVAGALSERDAAFLEPMYTLFGDIKPGEDLHEYLDRQIEDDNPAIKRLFGHVAVEASRTTNE